MVANSPQARKQKGRAFQQQIRDLLLETFTELEEDDVRSTSMGASGTDIQLSPAAQKLIPYAIECKCQEKVSLRNWWEQAKANANSKLAPLLITKQSRKEPLVVMDMKTFMKLIKHA